jgi:hypothetical protein
MQIKYVKGDATRPIGEGPKIIPHICNDVGVFGAGFVLALSKRWPITKKAYLAWAEAGPLVLGEVQFVGVEDGISVANIIGQTGVGQRNGPPIRYSAVLKGLRTVARAAQTYGCSIHAPRLGCGLAGGEWSKMELLLEDTFIDNGIPVTIYDL